VQVVGALLHDLRCVIEPLQQLQRQLLNDVDAVVYVFLHE
jgi:hypothetical protein